MSDAAGQRVFVRGYGATQAEAIRRRTANLQKRMAKGELTRTPRSPLISTYLEEWLELKGDEQTATSKKRHRRQLEQWVLPHLDKPLSAVTAEDIQRLFRVTLPKRAAGPSSIYNSYAALRALYSFARKQGIIPRDFDPLSTVPIAKPKPKVREEDDRLVGKRLNVSKYLLRWLADERCELHQLYPRILLMFLGLRRAELLGLEWSCIKNLDKAGRAHLTVRQQLMGPETGKGWHIQGRTKTGENRVVPLPEVMRKALLSLSHNRVEAQEAWAQDLVFLTAAGKHVTYNKHAADWELVLRSYMGKNSRKLREDDYFRPHTARRLCVSFLAEAGIPLETAKAILGHKTIKMTEYYYSVSRQETRRAATALDALLAQE